MGGETGFDVKQFCVNERATLETMKERVMQAKRHGTIPGEIGANITLAYRHLEDARMRFGKALQALDGGTSCYKQ